MEWYVVLYIYEVEGGGGFFLLEIKFVLYGQVFW